MNINLSELPFDRIADSDLIETARVLAQPGAPEHVFYEAMDLHDLDIAPAIVRHNSPPQRVLDGVVAMLSMCARDCAAAGTPLTQEKAATLARGLNHPNLDPKYRAMSIDALGAKLAARVLS